MEPPKPKPRKQPQRDSDILQKLCDRFDQIENRLTRIEQVNNEMKKIVTDVLEQTTSFSKLKSSEKYLKFESESQSGTSVTPHSEDVIDDNICFKNTSVTKKSDMTSTPMESVVTNTSSSNSTDRNESEVIDLSQAQLIATFQSYLSGIEKDCAELKCLVEDGMIPSTESLLKPGLPQPKIDENEPGSNPINNARTHLIEEILPNGNSSEVSIPGALELLADVAETVTAPTSTQAAKWEEKEVLPKEEIPAYCGQVHKDLHWNSGHEYSCGKKALKLGWKEVRGNQEVNNGLPYYVATKNLEVGLEIFSKKPLFTFPKISEERDECLFDGKFPEFSSDFLDQDINSCVCIICNEIMMYGELMEDPLNGIRLNKCPRCGWPVHSPRDVNLQNQSNNSCQDEHSEECKIFADNQKIWDKVKDLEGLYFHLGVLRVVLNEDVKNKLLKLPVSPGPCPYLESISNFVRDCCKQNQVSEQEWIKIIHVVYSNYLPSSSSYFSLRKKHNCIIYGGGHTGRILPHACNPNCRIHVDPKTGEATFKTRRKVEKGEMLTISYIMDEFPQPIDERALSLTKYHVHRCGCDKCIDGKDLTSAIKCEGGKKKHQKGCKSKYLMPFATRLQETPMNKTQEKSLRRGKVPLAKNQGQPNANKQDQVNPDTSNLYFWQCPSCKSLGPRMEQSIVEQKVERIRKEIYGEFLGRYYQELMALIKKYSKEELHPDHSIILLGQVALGYLAVEQMRGLISTGESRTLVHQSYSSDLDKAVEMLERNDNGRSEVYGTLLYGSALLQMRHLVTMWASTDKLKPTVVFAVQSVLESIINKLEESWEIIGDNPYLSALEIRRDITLFYYYSMGLENDKDLVESSQGYMFERFRRMQSKSLETAIASPPGGSWYLYKVKWDENHDSSKKTDSDAPESSENADQNVAKIELKERINIISGDFISELFLPDEY